MIKLESAQIEEMRGIRKLDINFDCKKFAVSGPNGSGKSGVIDAIEFGLTGDIGRLAGKGTEQLSIKEHGPHVDKVKFPDAAFVRLKVFFPDLDKSATITRTISAAQKPKIEPADPDILAAVKEVEEHPEIVLSRREVLKFIITEPTTRSQDIQIILKLDGIGQTRAALNTAQNTLKKKQGQAETAKQERRDALTRHLDIKRFDANELLEVVNKRREALDLPKFAKLEADTKLDVGVAEGGKAPEFNKQSALRDLSLVDDTVAGLAAVGKKEAAIILDALGKLEADPVLLTILHRRTLIEKGLTLVDGPECPLCDHEWEDEGKLRDHLRSKLAKSQEAGKLNDTLLKAGGDLGREAIRVAGLIGPVAKISTAEGEAETSAVLAAWTQDIEQIRGALSSLDGITGLKDRLSKGWADMPIELAERLKKLRAKIEAKPDQSARVEAQTFLATAQARIVDYRDASREVVTAARVGDAAKAAHDAYCRAMEEELNELYKDVQKDFADFYRIINEGDEEQFTATLTPTEGRLDLLVNFYEKGLFPPAAFHSEGHQDGMGVCLYLALMKRLLGKRFTFALMDDVVMSVDVGHRYQFCKLLREQFPDTQFVITTHDCLWAEQMRHAGVVSSKTSLVFQNWTVDTGPIVESDEEIWVDIDAALTKGKVQVAAAMLRHHLEYAVPRLAENLGARAVFRADGAYELGDLMPSVLNRMGELLGKAASAAHSWNEAVGHQAASNRKSKLAACNGAKNVEEWAVNKAVHYNAWANFGKKDFQPVVSAFKDLMSQFRCETCHSWIYITPKGSSPETLRCSCTTTNLNLKAKPK